MSAFGSKAHYPVVIGLAFKPRVVDGKIVEETPADWPKADREQFWEGLLTNIDKMTGMLIPKTEAPDSVTLAVNSKLKVPAIWWRPENRSATMKLMADVQSQVGEIAEFKIGDAENAQEPHKTPCPVCYWIHDPKFNRIEANGRQIVLLNEKLLQIIALVHRAHENGHKGLFTKDDELLKICGRYKSPCKVFDDLGHRDEYKALFYTRKRGYISLRGALGIKSE